MLGCCACVLASTIWTTDADAWVETVLHSFDNKGSDGYNPFGALTLLKGSLYGTAAGGAYGYGIVFSIDPGTGDEPFVYSFGSTKGDGTDPVGSLLNVGRILYGTTSEGGTGGAGTIFELDPATGAETTLYNFATDGYGDGIYPLGSLIIVKGTLYGTTGTGGAYGEGSVFSFDLSNKSETVLYSFCSQVSCADGASPNAGLVCIRGMLYGTASASGSYGFGVVFSLDVKTEKETVIHSFQKNDLDGTGPASTVIGVNSQLYGTTPGGGAYGGGTLYSIDRPSGTERVRYSFPGEPGGWAPNSSLINISNTLYGTTLNGGSNNWGTVFSFDRKTGKEKVLHSFDENGTDGALPYTALLYLNNRFYGTTASGGSSTDCKDGCGTVFEVKP